MQKFAFCSSIVKNEFFVLTQIIQNIKLIEYIINGQFKILHTDNNSGTETNNNKDENIIIDSNNDKEKEKNNSFIHVNDKFIIILKKKKDLNDWFNANNISFKIQLIKIREDNMIIQYKVILNNTDNESNNDINSVNNIITICIRKLTTNSSFIFIRCSWDFSLEDNIINSINSFIKKCLYNIEKLSKTSKQY